MNHAALADLYWSHDTELQKTISRLQACGVSHIEIDRVLPSRQSPKTKTDLLKHYFGHLLKGART